MNARTSMAVDFEIEDQPATISAWISYDSGDPWAVQLEFGDGPELTADEPVVWTFARELLHAGLNGCGPAGEGDVQICSSQPDIYLRLRSPSGRVILRTAWADIKRFLDHSYALVGRGHEQHHQPDLTEYLINGDTA